MKIKLTQQPKRNLFTLNQLKALPEQELVLNANGNLNPNSPLIVRQLPKKLKIDYNPPTPADIGPVLNYDNSPLFVGKPNIHDVAQGYVADCYFLASLAAIAFVREDIPPFFVSKQNPNYYMVRYQGNVEDHVFINADLGYSEDRIPPSGAIWVPMFEKSYAFYRMRANTYSSLNYGYPPLPQLGFTQQ